MTLLWMGLHISPGIQITLLILDELPGSELYHLIMLCLKLFFLHFAFPSFSFSHHPVVFVF